MNIQTMRQELNSAITDATALAPAIRGIVVGSRTDVPFIRVRTYTQLLERQMRATLLPARAASRADPSSLLRAE